MIEKNKRDARSNAYKPKMGTKVPTDRIEMMKKLRANGISYGIISKLTAHSKSTVQKYCLGVEILPQHKWQSVTELLSTHVKKVKPDYGFNEVNKKNKTPKLRDRLTEKELQDIDYWIDSHVEGKRFEGPLELINLDKLQEIMATVTDYHSPLSLRDWADKYLSGKGEGRILQHYPHKWSQSQYDMMDFWQLHRRAMFETFRDAGKTMVGTAIISHEIPENRDNNYFIMSETDIKATQRIKQIGNVLLTNKPMIADYGFLPHFSTKKGKRESWSAKQITVKRTFSQTDPTLMSFSTQSAGATGAHFAGGIYDDVWSFTLEQKSVENKRKWHGWRDNELEGCLENAWELFLLTRKGPYDLYQDLEDSGMYAVFKRPAVAVFPSDWKPFYKTINDKKIFDRIEVYSNDGVINDDGNGRFSIEYFLYKKMKMKATAFESEYQLNPLELVGKYFQTDKIRPLYGYKEFMEKLRKNGTAYKILGVMDLAFSNAPGADFNALTIWVGMGGQYYFLETYLKRTASDSDRKAMLQMAKNDFPSLINVYVEADLQQSAKVKELKKACPFVMILPVYSREEQQRLSKEDSIRRAGLTGKAARIHSQWEDPMGAGIVHINVHMRHYKELQDEFAKFPQCDHFDIIDSGGNAISLLRRSPAMLFAQSGGAQPMFNYGKRFFVSSSGPSGWDNPF